MNRRPGAQLDADFADFAAAQSRPLLGLAYALTGNPHDAWDLTQETLARLGERWTRVRLQQSVAFARTVMVRLNIDRLRRAYREFPLTGAPREDFPAEPATEVDSRLVEALATLSPRRRATQQVPLVNEVEHGCIRGAMSQQRNCPRGNSWRSPRPSCKARHHANRDDQSCYLGS
jgi:DNA-directed RNA polymerase specialized sigma24 family protein